MRRFKFGWYGDNNLGERLISMVLEGTKTASVCPAYDPQDADIVAGEKMLLVDKHNRVRGTLLVTQIEHRLLRDVDEALATAIGTSLPDLIESLSFANGRELKVEEDLRVTHFKLLSTESVR